MWDLFKKNKTGNSSGSDNGAGNGNASQTSAPKLNMIQQFMMKRLMKMSDKERQKLMEEFLKPENIAKHKDEILTMLDGMKNSGQISDAQLNMIKSKLGI